MLRHIQLFSLGESLPWGSESQSGVRWPGIWHDHGAQTAHFSVSLGDKQRDCLFGLQSISFMASCSLGLQLPSYTQWVSQSLWDSPKGLRIWEDSGISTKYGASTYRAPVWAKTSNHCRSQCMSGLRGTSKLLEDHQRVSLLIPQDNCHRKSQLSWVFSFVKGREKGLSSLSFSVSTSWEDISYVD